MFLVCPCPLFLKLLHILLRGLPSLFLGLLLTLFPYSGDLYAGDEITISKSGTDLWRAVRQRGETVKGISQVPITESGILINSIGHDWLHYRMKWLFPLSGGLFLPKIWEHWVLRLGGYFDGREPISGKFNPGQKAWFWTLSLFGTLLFFSGLDWTGLSPVWPGTSGHDIGPYNPYTFRYTCNRFSFYPYLSGRHWYCRGVPDNGSWLCGCPLVQAAPLLLVQGDGSAKEDRVQRRKRL